MDSGLGGSFRMMASAAEGAAIAVGEAAAKPITEWLNKMQAGAARAAEWVRIHQGMIVNAAKFAATLIVVGGALVGLGKTLGAVSFAMRTLSASISFLAANPIVAIIAGFTALALALERVQRAQYRTSDEMAKMRDQTEKTAAADFARMDRIKELAAKERMNNEEMQEAKGLIETLTNRYGDLGLRIDETTGKLHGEATAWSRLVKARREAALAALKAELAEIDTNINLKRKQTGRYGAGHWLLGQTGLGPTLEDLEREVQNLDLNRSAVIQKMRAINGDDETAARAAMTGSEAGATGGAGSGSAGGAGNGGARAVAQTAADEEEKLRERLHDLRIAQIEDETQRELDAITARYDRELAEMERAAKEKGKTLSQTTLDLHHEARGMEYDAVHQKAQAALDEANANRRLHNEELALELQYEGAELEREMLALEERRALEAAERAGENLDLVREEYHLRRQIAERAASAREEASERLRTAGTFSPFEVSGLGTRSLQERIASATERTAKAVERRQQDARYK